MAKKPKKDKAPADAGTSRADQLRAAVEGAFGATTQGAGPVQKRAAELADELVGVATRLREAISGDELSKLRETLSAGGTEPAATAARVREAVEGLRPPSAEQLEALRDRVAALEARVAELEAKAAAPAPAPAPTARRAPARKPAGAAARPKTGGTTRATAPRKAPGTGRRKPAGDQGS